MNQKKKGAVAVTLLSALLFCLLPVLVSLSPLAETGRTRIVLIPRACEPPSARSLLYMRSRSFCIFSVFVS